MHKKQLFIVIFIIVFSLIAISCNDLEQSEEYDYIFVEDNTTQPDENTNQKYDEDTFLTDTQNPPDNDVSTIPEEDIDLESTTDFEETNDHDIEIENEPDDTQEIDEENISDIDTTSQTIPEQLPDPDNSEPDTTKPVKVYILSGQSNMVGMGDIAGGSSRWGDEMKDPVVSIYAGPYSATTDYDSETPITTKALSSFGGTNPETYPDLSGNTAVVRGFIEIETTGIYQFKPGYGGSTYNIMEVDSVEVHRRETGENSVYTPFNITGGQRYSFKITYLNDQANGLGWTQRTDIPGTLTQLAKNEGKFPHLVDDNGSWTVRNDVTYKGVISALAQGNLTVGIQGNTIGPELQFGHIMGYYHDEPVLIIKASQGNRSLAWDILPPGSERYTVDGVTYAGYGDKDPSWSDDDPYTEVNWYAGKQYDDFVQEINNVLDNFSTMFPAYKDQGYEIAGFAWFQGHKDTGNAVHANRYEFNLVNFIKAFRAEFNAENAPFLIATIGFNGWEMSGNMLTVANAQLAVSGETGNYPEFADNVKTVETRDFWRSVEVSPQNQGYHYNRNAETYMLVGDALGRGMVELFEK